jgi:hypothetical protein
LRRRRQSFSYFSIPGPQDVEKKRATNPECNQEIEDANGEEKRPDKSHNLSRPIPIKVKSSMRTTSMEK